MLNCRTTRREAASFGLLEAESFALEYERGTLLGSLEWQCPHILRENTHTHTEREKAVTTVVALPRPNTHIKTRCHFFCMGRRKVPAEEDWSNVEEVVVAA